MSLEPERIPGGIGTEQASPDEWSDGDASVHLEELVVAPLAPLSGSVGGEAASRAIELVGAHLRLSGTVRIGHHRRLSDFINHHEGLMELHDATVLRRNGDPTRVTAASIWVSPPQVTLIGELGPADSHETPRDVVQARVRHGLVVVTPGHTLTGDVFLSPEAELSAFIASSYPPYIPITNARTRSLADRRVVSRYAFALLNRSHIVAATGLQPGMAVGRTAL